MKTICPAAFVYLPLLALSLPIPLLHQFFTDGVIETMRPIIQLGDGRWVSTLMPVHVLFLRYLGQLSWSVPCGFLALLIMSLANEDATRWVKRSETLCFVAIVQCLFSTAYAIYATWLLGHQWMTWK